MKQVATDIPQTIVLERQCQVLKRIPISRSTWWRWVKEGRAPKPIKLGKNITAWRSNEIDDFIQNLVDGDDS